MIYLDNHTATKPDSGALAAMAPFLEKEWGKASAPHLFGQRLLGSCEEAEAAINALVGGRSADRIVMTGSGSAAVAHVVQAAYLDIARETGRNHFLTSALGEAPTILAFERMEGLGCETGLIPVDPRGIVTPDALAESLNPRTGLVSLPWANALTGVVQPVAELAEVCKERGIWLHLDASHVLGRLDFDLDEIAPDFVTFDGGLLHAPGAPGALWIRSGLNPSPLIMGEGPSNVPLLVGLGVACREAQEKLPHVAMETARLKGKLEAGLNGEVLFCEAERTPTTTAIAFEGVTADALLYRLQRQGVYASFGGGTYQHLALQLETCGIGGAKRHCAVSFSLSRETTTDEIDRAIETINATAASLRQLSEAIL